jgi:hypothetical protein
MINRESLATCFLECHLFQNKATIIFYRFSSSLSLPLVFNKHVFTHMGILISIIFILGTHSIKFQRIKNHWKKR